MKRRSAVGATLLWSAMALTAHGQDLSAATNSELKVVSSEVVPAPMVKEIDGAPITVAPLDDGWLAIISFNKQKPLRDISINWPNEPDLPTLTLRIPYTLGPIKIPVEPTDFATIATNSDAVRDLFDGIKPMDVPPEETLPYLAEVHFIAAERSDNFKDLDDVDEATAVSVYLYLAAAVHAADTLRLGPLKDENSAIAWLASGRERSPDVFRNVPEDAASLEAQLEDFRSLFVKDIYNSAATQLSLLPKQDVCPALVARLTSLMSKVLAEGATGAQAIWKSQGIGPLHILNAISQCVTWDAKEGQWTPELASKVRAQIVALSDQIPKDPWANGTFTTSPKYSESKTAKMDIANLRKILDKRSGSI